MTPIELACRACCHAEGVDPDLPCAGPDNLIPQGATWPAWRVREARVRATIAAYEAARSAECELVGPSYEEFLDCIMNHKPIRPTVALPPRGQGAGGRRPAKEKQAMPTMRAIDERDAAFIALALRAAADAYERRAEEDEAAGQDGIAGECRRQAEEMRRLADRIEGR